MFLQVMEFSKALAHRYIVSKSLEMVLQFQKGLNANGVLDALRKEPQKGMRLLTASVSTTAGQMLNCLEVVYNRKTDEEEDIYAAFTEFIEMAANGVIPSVTTANLEDIEEGVATPTEKQTKVSLEMVIQHLTGKRRIDIGDAILVKFVHETKRVVANVCSYEITFPVCPRYTNEEGFSSRLAEDFLNSPGFGVH